MSSKKPEITIALIGLCGVLTTAVLSNLDKIFPKQEIRASYNLGHKATNDFETEVRRFINISGTRKTYESMQQQLLNTIKMNLKPQYPGELEEIDMLMNSLHKKNMRLLDDTIRKMLPIYKKHFTIEEIQELNKYYSTETMQNMVKKMPLLAAELEPIYMDMIQEWQEWLMYKLHKSSFRTEGDD